MKDLDGYLRRIGYRGPRTATLETLHALHLHHAQSIAFENLNPLLGLPVPLDLASLERKLVQEGRGGYCFEQNLLFASVLRSLGFRVTGLAARVLWNAAEGAVTARTHMLLQLDLDAGPHIADVGFGGMTLTGPLRLEAGVEQSTPHEPFRLVAEGAGFIMQAKVREAWKSLYWFDLHAELQPDYEVTNWYLANHPDSRFVRNLVAGRATPQGRFALLNREFAIHHLGGASERHVLESAAELRTVLEDYFLIRLPKVRELGVALERALRHGGS
jgi:N-hydroxyarylamine O-acetyltransferase